MHMYVKISQSMHLSLPYLFRDLKKTLKSMLNILECLHNQGFLRKKLLWNCLRNNRKSSENHQNSFLGVNLIYMETSHVTYRCAAWLILDFVLMVWSLEAQTNILMSSFSKGVYECILLRSSPPVGIVVLAYTWWLIRNEK